MTATKLLLAAAALLIALPAAAQPMRGPKGPPKTWDISLGAGASWRNPFEGSDR